ncbi:transcription factor Adf-1 [Elysia marginata]|uniref:Transcription factor Adf-1 n=1 Tax=Elysia marginata TaxID=1093978 RepID=A0AAV4JLE4_9GAST|nr:transcription factor Adf-1 [Elysia marginata]
MSASSMPYQPLLFISNLCQVHLHAINVNDSVVEDANILYDVIHQTFICVHTLVQDAPLGNATLKKKWKYLRDNFSIKYSKRPVSRSGDGADNLPASKWQYFQQLLFLKDVISPRSCTGSLTASLNSRLNVSSIGVELSAEQDILNEHSPADTPKTISPVSSSHQSFTMDDASTQDAQLPVESDEAEVAEVAVQGKSTPRTAVKRRKGPHDAYY